jgi:DNA-binding IclR family transcriptional regulator
VNGVGSTAVCVADPLHGEILAFCLSFPAQQVPASERRRYGAMLTGIARRIGARFNDPFWTHLPKAAA